MRIGSDRDLSRYVPAVRRPKSIAHSIRSINRETDMMHCECGWAWEWDDDPTPYCPFCGKIGAAGPGAPQEAKEAIVEANEE